MTLYFSQAHFSLLGLRLFFLFFSSAIIYLQCFLQQFEEVQQVHLVKFFCSMAFQILCITAQNCFCNLTSNDCLSFTLSIDSGLYTKQAPASELCPCCPSACKTSSRSSRDEWHVQVSSFIGPAQHGHPCNSTIPIKLFLSHYCFSWPSLLNCVL